MTYTIDRFKSGLGHLTALTAVIPAAACLSGGGNADRTVVRDSVGIEIIESNQAAWGEGQEWQLSAEPLLEIGDAEGDSLYEFYGITGVHRTGDGRIVVANAGTYEIRFYDAEGRFLRAVGRRGEGPSEYRGIGRLDVVRDSLFVSDYGNVRISVLTLDGAFVRSVNMSALGLTIPRTVGLFSDGSILLRADAVEDLEFKAGVNHALRNITSSTRRVHRSTLSAGSTRESITSSFETAVGIARAAYRSADGLRPLYPGTRSTMPTDRTSQLRSIRHAEFRCGFYTTPQIPRRSPATTRTASSSGICHASTRTCSVG